MVPAMKHVIHVHQQRIKRGLSAIIDRTYKGSTWHTWLGIQCPHCGELAAEIVQTPEPDSCGAKVSIRASATVKA